MTAQRPTYVEIDLAALCHNYRLVRRQAGPERAVLAVVKADAYGHGASRVAPALEAAGVDLFGVAIVEEGVELREAGVTRPIVVLGGVYAGQEEELLRHQLTPCLADLESLRRLDAAAQAVGTLLSYHLKLDTGMGRIGVTPEQLADLLPELQGLKGLHLDGVVSHLALADDPGHPFTATQLVRFRDALAQVRAAGFAPRYVHTSNSAALFSQPLAECNLVRPGIVLYGSPPYPDFPGAAELQPVMSIRSRIAQLKEVPAGTGVSYSHRFVAARPTLIASIPVGYADGYNRHLSCQGEVLVRGRRVPVVGTVCMDWTMLDVSDVPGVAVGDEVTLLGRDNGCRISAEEWAQKIGTISYEVYCQVSKRVPRFFKCAVGGEGERPPRLQSQQT